MTRAPLGPFAAAFAAGIAAEPWVPASVAWAVLLATAAAGAVLVWLDRPDPALWALLAATLGLGMLRAGAPPLTPGHVARLPLPAPAVVEGRIVGEPRRVASGRVRLVLEAERVEGTARSGRIQLTLYGPGPPLDAGQRIRVATRLHRAHGFRNPGGFDYGTWLRREGIHVVASAAGTRVVTLDAPGPRWPVRIRRAALASVADGLPPTSAALLAGLLLGDRTLLPADVDDAFRRAGVYHVLAVSGFNVALVAAAVFALARVAALSRRSAALAAIVIVLGFALVVGGEPSVVRAVVMAVLVLLALFLDREASVVNGLAVAGLGLLAARPGDLYDPGFQLSFAATAGIVATPLPRGRLAGALAVSAAAQLAVLPITLAHFNQASPLGVVVNLAVVPLAGAATVLGLVAVALSAVAEAAAGAAFGAVWPVLLLLRGVVAVAASVPFAVVHLPAPPGLAVAGYAAALAIIASALRRGDPALEPVGRRRRAGAATLAGGLVLAATVLTLWPVLRPADGRLRVFVLDVGQAEAIVLETPDGAAFLIDAGSGGPTRLDAGERVVAPFLWNRGHRRLAGALVTHGDTDHAGGMASIRRLFRIGDACRPETLATGPCWLGGAVGRALDPPRPADRSARRTTNAGSLVLRIDHGLASILLTGDIGEREERRLLALGAPVAARVLKVAHHGSRRSSSADFLHAVRPSVAVLSVGPRNPYGHPDPGVLARLADAGARTYRTDQDGAVILETDGRELRVTRWARRTSERWCLDAEAIC